MKGTTFENELRKIFDDIDELTDKKYIGRAFYGKIDGNLRLKAQYITLGYAGNYSALKTEVIRRDEGVVDTTIIRFGDLWGNKQTTNPNFREGVIPHLWTSGQELDWYVYTPTPADMQMLSDEIEDFIAVYQDLEQGMGGMNGM